MHSTKTAGKLLAILISIGLAIASWAAPAQAVDELGLFELDENAQNDGGTTGDDWDTVNLGGGGGSFASTGVLADPAPSTIFTTGGSKDPQNVSSWRHKNGSVPDKDNITNAYAAAYNSGSDLVIYFGADRFANDGDAQIGFWFFQDEITLLNNGRFDGVHEVGDILVLANFSQGGDVSTINVFQWVGTGGEEGGGTLHLLFSGSDVACVPGGPDHTVCAVANTDPTPSPWPYTPKSGPAGSFPTTSFFEGGINLSALLRASGQNTPCFASFLAETRSSTSVTATLKDFVLGAFDVCSAAITKECNDARVNDAGTAFTYSYEGTVTNNGFGTLFTVTVIDNAGTPNNTSDDQTISLGTLTPGQTKNYSGEFDSLDDPATNIARVTAEAVAGGGISVDEESDPAVCPRPPQGTISVTKACSACLKPLNNRVVVQIDFDGQVCNTGAVPLTSVTVTDDAGTAGTSDDQVINIGTLAAQECKPYSGSYLPSSINNSPPAACTDPEVASFKDTVTAKGTGIGGSNPESTSTATCDVCSP